MGGVRRLLAPALLAGAAGCSLLLPLDGLTGSGTDAGLEAGGPDAANGDAAARVDAPPDAAVDAGIDATDGSSATDAKPAADASPDVAAGPIACADAGVLLCEDFENGLDATKWVNGGNVNGTAVVDTTQAHRGTHALHSISNALPGDAGPVNVTATIGHYVTVPSTVYIRMFLRLAQLPSNVESFIDV